MGSNSEKVRVRGPIHTRRHQKCAQLGSGESQSIAHTRDSGQDRLITITYASPRRLDIIFIFERAEMPRSPLAALGVCAGAVMSANSAFSIFYARADDERSKQQEWAYPSPYDADVPSARFAETAHLRSQTFQWDLSKLVDIWRDSKEEGWPWVWCDRNPVGPHHLFIGVNGSTLSRVAALSRESVNNNITVVVSERDLVQAGVSEAQLNALRAAVIFVPVQQLNVANRIVMLADERIIVYDAAYLA